jgi:hypothetical protein
MKTTLIAVAFVLASSSAGATESIMITGELALKAGVCNGAIHSPDFFGRWRSFDKQQWEIVETAFLNSAVHLLVTEQALDEPEAKSLILAKHAKGQDLLFPRIREKLKSEDATSKKSTSLVEKCRSLRSDLLNFASQFSSPKDYWSNDGRAQSSVAAAGARRQKSARRDGFHL